MHSSILLWKLLRQAIIRNFALTIDKTAVIIINIYFASILET